MIAIYKRLLKDKLFSFLAFCVSGVLMVFMYIALLPTVQASQAQLAEFMKAMPEGLMKAFGVSGVDLSTLEALLAMKHYNLVWPLILIFLACSIAASAVAGEAENGTIEITLSSAKSRVNIFFARYLAGLTYVFSFSIITILSAIVLAEIFGYDYQVQNHLTLTYLALAFSFAVYGISFMLSSLSSSRGKVFAVSGLLYVGMYVIFILSSLKESIKDIQYASFFYYFDYNNALLFNNLDRLSVVVFLIAGLVASSIALVVFIERDIAV